jgi:hypothetical protein
MFSEKDLAGVDITTPEDHFHIQDTAVTTAFEWMICNRNLIHSVTVHNSIFWLNCLSKSNFLSFHYHYFIICKPSLFGTMNNPKNILTDERAEVRR